MSTWYQPEKVLVCGKLAGDYHAGLLLAVITRRYPYAKATLKGTAGTWSANARKVWFEAAGMSRNQGDRALATLEQRGLIERAHGAWGGNPNVLYVRPTRRAQAVWHTATTFEALDAVLGGNKSDQLRKLWQAWPDKDPKKRGAIAEWYEQLDRKLSKDVYGKPLNLKPVLWPCCNR
jgi:DNA-binding transcriptional MocR family regulator